nr:hypothetical protein CFP56_20232 [Quercus suber]
MVERGDEGRLGDGGVQLSDLGHGVGGRLGTSDEDVVGDAEAQEVAAAVRAEDGAELVLDVVATGGVQVDAVQLEPGPPEDAADPHAVPVDGATHVVAAGEFDLVLDVEVDHADDAIGGQEVGHGVDGRVELGDHAQAVGHGEHVGADRVTCILVVGGPADAEVPLLALLQAGLVVRQPEQPGVLTDHVHILPAESFEALARNVAEGGAEIDEVDGVEEFGDIELRPHLLDIPAGAAADVDPNGLLADLAGLAAVLDLGGDESEHILAALQQTGASGIVDGSLGFVEALEGVLLVAGAVAGVGLEEAGVGEVEVVEDAAPGLAEAAEIGDGEDDEGDEDEGEEDGTQRGAGHASVGVGEEGRHGREQEEGDGGESSRAQRRRWARRHDRARESVQARDEIAATELRRAGEGNGTGLDWVERCRAE